MHSAVTAPYAAIEIITYMPTLPLPAFSALNSWDAPKMR